MVQVKPPVLIVDGYNIIGTWENLRALKQRALGSARDQLVSMLAGYRPWCWERIIVVFDGRTYGWQTVDGVEVVFTGETETADTLIERLAAGLAACCAVEVATSDFAELRAASGFGAYPLSAAALRERLEEQSENLRNMTASMGQGKLGLGEFVRQPIREALEKFRRS